MATPSENMRGAGLMMASMAAYTLNDSCMKALSGDLPLFQAVFLRGVATVGFLFLMAHRAGALRIAIPRRDWGLIALRAASEIGAAWFFVTALFHAPQANVTAILQALPLTVTLAAALFLNEPIGWRRMLAIMLGFVGVMLIVRPGMAGFSLYSVYALVAVVFVTLRDLTVRRMSAGVPSISVALVTAVAVMLAAGLGTLTEPWAPVSRSSTSLIAAAVVFIIGGSMFSVMVMRVGEIAFVTPFRYTSLLWALALGWLVFGDWPDVLTLAGSAIVVATGVFTLYRERRARA